VGVTAAPLEKAQPPLLAGIRAGGSTSIAFPGALFRRTQWLRMMEAESPNGNSSAYRCGGSAGWVRRGRHSLLLPVELRHANHTASTNPCILRLKSVTKPYNSSYMPSASQIDQVAERVERLLVRYEELQRTNKLLAEQVEVLTNERDSLKSRLLAARARVEALLERLPDIKSTV
jgi:hypothetical protein